MENQWITNSIEKLKRLHGECGAEEVALSRYISCMIRMLNGLAQMEYAQFHFYEKLILKDALEIFTGYFIEQIEEAKSELDVLKKRDLIDDIENAIDRMAGVYKNVIDSTANSDRQMLSSISIDTSIYELSPKICAFYSLILNKLVKMFEEDSRKYAFLLHPTLKNNTETQVMFERRNQSGKVVIIYISESIIEMVDVVSVFILHEAFHVLTKKERMRKKRMKTFVQLMLAGMKQVLFEGVTFSDDEKKNEAIEDRLLELFFFDCQNEMNQWECEDEDSRKFYSSEVKMWANWYFQTCLANINISLEKLIRENMYQDFSGMDYKAFKQISDKEEMIINQIKANLSKAMLDQRVASFSERFLFIYREIYADIACILTLQLDPDNYKEAFEESKQFYYDKRYYDRTRTVRNYIVALSVSSHMPADINELWKKFARNLLNEFSQKNFDSYEKDSTFSQSCVMLNITPQMQQALKEYGQDCAKSFSNRVESISEIQSFRESMSKVRNCDKTELMKRIMIGDFGKIF